MGVESEAKETVQLLAEKVFPFQNFFHENVEKRPNVPINKFHQYQYLFATIYVVLAQF